MPRRAILTYRKHSDNTEKKIYIRDGVVVNPAVDKEITEGLDDYTAVALRRTGEKKRILEYVPEPELEQAQQ